jgi:hypothetical protein
MPKYLVIVESPAKTKKIESFLGSDYVVQASFGHIMDLDSKNLSIDVDNNFEPHYIVSPDKKKTVINSTYNDTFKIILNLNSRQKIIINSWLNDCICVLSLFILSLFILSVFILGIDLEILKNSFCNTVSLIYLVNI